MARRVLIVVQGDVGDFAGAQMIAGSIIIFGRLGECAGAGNKRGSIVVFGGSRKFFLHISMNAR